MDNLFWHFGQQTGWRPQQPAEVELPALGAHIWFFEKAQNFLHADVVSDAELNRAQDMLPPAARQEFLSFRACLRVVLALYHIKTMVPKSIRIEISEHGKPWLPDEPRLHFNLSHSHGALAIAVSRVEIGVDIEKIRPVPDLHDLAQNFLAPTDAASIASHAETEQSAAFLRCFTAREAYLKALGTGFSTRLPAMDFHSRHGRRQISDGRDCRVASLPPLPDFVGHVCLLDKYIP